MGKKFNIFLTVLVSIVIIVFQIQLSLLHTTLQKHIESESKMITQIDSLYYWQQSIRINVRDLELRVNHFATNYSVEDLLKKE